MRANSELNQPDIHDEKFHRRALRTRVRAASGARGASEVTWRHRTLVLPHVRMRMNMRVLMCVCVCVCVCEKCVCNVYVCVMCMRV